MLFGRETSGLTNDELQRCNVHLQIPANPAYPSLNVAMAVQVVCYELYQATLDPTAEPSAAAWDREPATVAAVDGLLEHFEEVLTRVEFLDRVEPGAGDAAFAAPVYADASRRHRSGRSCAAR